MSRPRDWYVIPGIPSDVVRDYPSLPAGRLLTTTLNQTEISIVEGDYFKTHKWINVPALSSVYVLFTTPPASVLFALKSREIVSERSNVEYRTFVAFTGVVTGDTWPIFRENDRIPKVSQALFQDVVSVATIDAASEAEAAYIPPSGQGANTRGSLARGEGFKIVTPDQQILLEFKNNENASNQLLITYQWAEAPLSVAGG